MIADTNNRTITNLRLFTPRSPRAQLFTVTYLLSSTALFDECGCSTRANQKRMLEDSIWRINRMEEKHAIEALQHIGDVQFPSSECRSVARDALSEPSPQKRVRLCCLVRQAFRTWRAACRTLSHHGWQVDEARGAVQGRLSGLGRARDRPAAVRIIAHQASRMTPQCDRCAVSQMYFSGQHPLFRPPPGPFRCSCSVITALVKPH